MGTTKMASAGVRKLFGSGAGIRTLVCLASRKTLPPTSSRLLSTSTKRLGGGEPGDPYQGWTYRSYQQPPKSRATTGMHFLLMFTIYWWLFHNLIYDPGHILGPGVPDPVEWTDEELGIPPEEDQNWSVQLIDIYGATP